MFQVRNIQHLEVNKSDNWHFPLLPGSQWNIINHNEKQIEHNNVGVNQYAACITFISKICLSLPLKAAGTNCFSSLLPSQPQTLLFISLIDRINT